MRNSSVSDSGWGVHPVTRFVKVLLITQVIILLCQLISKKFGGLSLEHIFGLVPYAFVYRFSFWQIFTYPFLHSSLSHLLFNSITLWLFGSTLEARMGTSSFAKFYLVSCWGAGLFHLVVHFLFSSPAELLSPVVGSSAGNYAILMGFGLLYGEQVMFPFPVKAKFFVLGLGAIEVVSAVFYSEDGVAHLAHLGGMVIGFIWIYLQFFRPARLVLDAFRQVSKNNQFNPLSNSEGKSIAKKNIKNSHLKIVKTDDDFDKDSQNRKTWH